MLSRHSIAACLCVCGLPLALPACAGANDDPTGTARQAILDGEVVTDLDSPVLYLSGPQGTCTATLIAPNLVVTARHCIAETPDGTFTCTAQGDLVVMGTGAGQIGADDPPGMLSFYTNAQVMAGEVASGAPQSVGLTIVSSNTSTSCRDDIAFVVLQEAIVGLTPASIRLYDTTVAGETVSAWGYGLTTQPRDPFALRVRNDAVIEGVGPDMPTAGTPPAPLRAVRIGPDDITCNGDSGGPITSAATGAIIAIASLGVEANFSTPTCTDNGTPDTTGPRLAEYSALALSAFAAAGATPILEYPPEGGTDVEASTDADSAEGGDPAEGGSTVTPEDESPGDPIAYHATGGSCSMAHDPGESSAPARALAMAFAAMMLAAIRRRRRPSKSLRRR